MDNQPWSPQEVLMRSLLRAYYWMDESLQKLFEQRGLTVRTRTQTMLLVNISNGVTRSSDLARVLGISRQAVQQHISDLESDGLLHLIPDPKDKRANRIVFSESGAVFIREMLECLREAEELLLQRVGPERLDALRTVLMVDWGPIAGAQISARRDKSTA